MEQYEKGHLIGAGVHGRVYKGIHRATQKVVALKKVSVGDGDEGVAIAALREIAVIRELDSSCFIRLLDAFPHKKTMILVFEYMETDLESAIKETQVQLQPGHVKRYMQTLLQALSLLHQQGIMHRDIKPNNILLAANGEPKLADFGLARVIRSPVARLTKEIGGRSYRAPELLFGTDTYTNAVDIWAAGCVFAELLLRKVWFRAHSDMSQLQKIFQALGSPTPSSWPEMCSGSDLSMTWEMIEPPPLRSLFPPETDPLALDLLSKMVKLNPASRISAAEALEHPFFSSPPLPSVGDELYKPPRKQPPQPAGAMLMSHLMGLPASGSENDIRQLTAGQHSWGLPRPTPEISGEDQPAGTKRSFSFRIGTIPRRFSLTNLDACDSVGGGPSCAGAGSNPTRRHLFVPPTRLPYHAGPDSSCTTSEDGQWAGPAGPSSMASVYPLGLASATAPGLPTPCTSTSLPFTFAPTLASAMAAVGPTPTWPCGSVPQPEQQSQQPFPRPTPVPMDTGLSTAATTGQFKRRRLFESVSKGGGNERSRQDDPSGSLGDTPMGPLGSTARASLGFGGPSRDATPVGPAGPMASWSPGLFGLEPGVGTQPGSAEAAAAPLMDVTNQGGAGTPTLVPMSVCAPLRESRLAASAEPEPLRLLFRKDSDSLAKDTAMTSLSAPSDGGCGRDVMLSAECCTGMPATKKLRPDVGGSVSTGADASTDEAVADDTTDVACGGVKELSQHGIPSGELGRIMQADQAEVSAGGVPAGGSADKDACPRRKLNMDQADLLADGSEPLPESQA